MSQAVKCNFFLCADDASLVCQHDDINEIEKQLNKDSESICDWFVDNKVSIQFDTLIQVYILRLNSK